jgi:hypothetical protein
LHPEDKLSWVADQDTGQGPRCPTDQRISIPFLDNACMHYPRGFPPILAKIGGNTSRIVLKLGESKTAIPSSKGHDTYETTPARALPGLSQLRRLIRWYSLSWGFWQYLESGLTQDPNLEVTRGVGLVCMVSSCRLANDMMRLFYVIEWKWLSTNHLKIRKLVGFKKPLPAIPTQERPMSRWQQPL